MTKQSKIVAGVLAGVAVGATVGLILYTNHSNGLKEKASDLLSNLMLTGKDKLASLADKIRSRVSEINTAIPNHQEN